MTEQNTSEHQTADAGATAPAPALEDVYAEFEVPVQQTQPAQSNRETPEADTQPPADLPDPITDPDGFRKAQARMFAELQKTVQDVKSQHEMTQAERAAAEQNQELDKIVDNVASSAEIDEKYKSMVRYALAERYTTDPKFKAIFDNRTQNPKAWDKVQKAMAPEIKKLFPSGDEGAIAEGQRAMNEAMSAGRHVSEQPANAEQMKMSNAEFDAWWSRQLSG